MPWGTVLGHTRRHRALGHGAFTQRFYGATALWGMVSSRAHLGPYSAMHNRVIQALIGHPIHLGHH